MSSLTVAAILQASILSTGAETYADARRAVDRTGKPMVVMVGTDWCAPCQRMKRSVLPQIRERGLLRKVAFAVVNADQQGKLARQLTGGGPIPQLVMYRKTRVGWRRRKLVGGQSVQAVEKFIKEGVALQEADKKAGRDEAEDVPRDDHAAAETPTAIDGALYVEPISTR